MRFVTTVPLLIAAFIALVTGPTAAQGLPPSRDVPYLGAINLRVDATDVDHKRLLVRETLPVRPGRLVLLYPLWVPGNHSPTNEIKRLTGLRIEAAGKVLPWQRDPEHFHAFIVDVPPGVASLDIAFQQVLPLSSTGSDALLTRRFIGVEWQGALLYPAGHDVSRIDVDATLRLPDGWTHGSALRPLGAAASGGELRFERVSLETLVDSPVFAARHAKRIELDPGSTSPVFLDLFAEEAASLDHTEAAMDAHRNLVRQADRLFGARHFAHYDILLALGDDIDMGLEHHQSSENGVKADYFKDWAKSVPARYLLPHEFAHSWNGKFRRPREMWTPDFNTPLRNSLLWVYEGQTQYWGEVLAARSGLMSAAEVRERLAHTVAWLQASAGRQWRSLQDTTDDAVMSGRKLPIEWRSWQRFEDYYNEGSLIWLEVDARIREASGGTRSLDDFARAFFGVEPGRVAPLLYDFADVVAALNAVQPFDWAPFLRARLDAPSSDAVFDGLARAGWRLTFTDKRSDYAKTADTYWKSADFTHSLGLRVGKEGKLSEVLWDSPAFRAGLTRGLTLLAVNLRAYTADGLRDAVTAAANPGGSPVELLLKDGSDYRIARIDWRGGLRYPVLERIDGKADLLTPILSAR
jgi:predicted metalloprotease with PDZ domain